MDKLNQTKWSTIPNHIVIGIGSYLPLYFQFELRLLNNHWSKAMNNLLFYSLETFKSHHIFPIVEKYGVYVKFISDTALHFVSMKKLQQLCPRVNQLSITLSTDDLSKIIQLLEGFPFLIKINICDCMESGISQNTNLDTITKLISQMKSLKFIEYSPFEPSEESSSKLYKLKLDSLNISSMSHDTVEFREQYVKVSNVSKVNWSINYSGIDPEVQNRSDLITPNFLLSYNTLKSLFLCIGLYSDSEGSIDDYLSQEFLKLFNNPNFSKLKDLEWLYLWSDNLNTYTLFDKPIPNTNCWPNLSRISLFLVDGHLLTYITQHCPNLAEFSITSPLALPIYDNIMDLVPLKKLKRLFIGGFHKMVIGNEYVFNHIFPNLSTLTLSLNMSTYITDETLIDAYYIPSLFPHLTYVILRSWNCKLDKLINEYYNPIKWEELYIELTTDNFHLLDFLLDKLPNLKLLYIYLQSSDIPLLSKFKNVRVFSVNPPTNTEFDFFICKELI